VPLAHEPTDNLPLWRPRRPFRLGPCLCEAPASTVWHWLHLVLKIYLHRNVAAFTKGSTKTKTTKIEKISQPPLSTLKPPLPRTHTRPLIPLALIVRRCLGARKHGGRSSFRSFRCTATASVHPSLDASDQALLPSRCLSTRPALSPSPRRRGALTLAPFTADMMDECVSVCGC